MNEVKELFEMVMKQADPDQDSWQQQEDRQRRAARKRRIGAFVAAAAIVVAAVIAFATLRGREEGLPAAPPSETPGVSAVSTHHYVDIATGNRSPVAADLSGARLAEVSPNGDAIAYNSCCSRDPLYVTDLNGSSKRVIITPDALDGYGATWIDDKTILFQGRATGTNEFGDLYVGNVSTGKMHVVTELPKNGEGLAWIVASDLSPDGTTVLFHLPRGNAGNEEWDLWTAPLAGGKATLLRKDAGFAAYAPDGSIVFLDHPVDFASEQISMMDGDGRNARLLVKGGASALSWPRVSPDGTMVAYGNEGRAEIVEIATGDVTPIDALSEAPAWDGNDTLIVDDEYH
jgi:Tol biopolymer transport system component